MPRAVLVLASIIVLSCSSTDRENPAEDDVSTRDDVSTQDMSSDDSDEGEDFVQHRDPLGFTLQKPAEWRVVTRGMTEIAVSHPEGSTVALIRARVVRGDLAQWLAHTYLGTETEVQTFNATSSQSISPDVARATLSFVDSTNMQKRASVVAVRQGEMVTVFAATASASAFASALPTLTRILDSFRFGQPGAQQSQASAAPRMQFVRWVDPNESAWMMEIPAGWRSEGGLVRRQGGAMAAYTITAPEGGFFFGGDQNVPRVFVLPSQTSLSLGYQEGQPMGPGGAIMLRFQDAASMGTGIFQRRFGQAQVVNVRQRPDLLEILRRNPTFQGSTPRMSAAEIEFRLTDGRVGVMALTTYGQEVQNLGGTWYVDNILGFIAPRERAAETAMALAHAIGTSRENPQWRGAEAAAQSQMGEQFRKYREWSNNLQQQTIEARWASDDAINRQRRDILGGTVRVRDPQTGETFETQGNNRYYYRLGGTNAVSGVDVDFNPAPQLDMRRLLQVGVDIPDR